ncbi:hypothetical protein KPL76_06935 [Subtercola sp. PAMC28395]|nr:hypothetical protein [Subtercola sp. PAMC28395]QWT25074.1 hypothetical protein KPL76_06935 [Subtercola sp. PAMC28395]
MPSTFPEVHDFALFAAPSGKSTGVDARGWVSRGVTLSPGHPVAGYVSPW